jgi:hypothetical protein
VQSVHVFGRSASESFDQHLPRCTSRAASAWARAAHVSVMHATCHPSNCVTLGLHVQAIRLWSGTRNAHRHRRCWSALRHPYALRGLSKHARYELGTLNCCAAAAAWALLDAVRTRSQGARITQRSAWRRDRAPASASGGSCGRRAGHRHGSWQISTAVLIPLPGVHNDIRTSSWCSRHRPATASAFAMQLGLGARKLRAAVIHDAAVARLPPKCLTELQCS